MQGFAINGKLNIQGDIYKTNFGFESNERYEKFLSNLEEKYNGCKEITFEGDMYFLEEAAFDWVLLNKYGNNVDYLTYVLEFHGENCYIPPGNNCFVKCI